MILYEFQEILEKAMKEAQEHDSMYFLFNFNDQSFPAKTHPISTNLAGKPKSVGRPTLWSVTVVTRRRSSALPN
jgi:hypothetical protein